MEEKKDNVELYEEDSIIELYDENDNAVSFREIAGVELDGRFFALLQPVEPMDDIGEDEVVIFEYVAGDNSDEKNLVPLFEEALLERVFNEYLVAVADMECDCDCCDCDDDCDDDGCDCGHHHCHHDDK